MTTHAPFGLYRRFALLVSILTSLCTNTSFAAEDAPASSDLVADSKRLDSSSALYTRTFRVDPDDFLPHNFPHLLDATPAEIIAAELQINAGLTNFSNAGEGRRLFYNDRIGLLMVRGTLPELNRVETALQRFNVTPPQVQVEVRIAE